MTPLAFGLAMLIGASLGLLGGGGAILTVPILVYVLDIPAKSAIAMSLPVVGTTSLVGALLHWRRGNVRVTAAARFGLLAMIGAFAGAKLSAFISGSLQLALLAVTMLVAAVSMLRPARPAQSTQPAPQARSLRVVVPMAIGTGALTGLVGAGGGFLIVPALVLVAGATMAEAVGTSLVVISMNTAAGFVGYLGAAQIDWLVVAGFTATAAIGAVAGVALGARSSPATLRRAFAVFLIVMGIVVLYQNRSAFRPTASLANNSSLSA